MLTLTDAVRAIHERGTGVARVGRGWHGVAYGLKNSANDSPLGDEGDGLHHRAATRADQTIDLVDGELMVIGTGENSYHKRDAV